MCIYMYDWYWTDQSVCSLQNILACVSVYFARNIRCQKKRQLLISKKASWLYAAIEIDVLVLVNYMSLLLIKDSHTSENLIASWTYNRHKALWVGVIALLLIRNSKKLCHLHIPFFNYQSKSGFTINKIRCIVIIYSVVSMHLYDAFTRCMYAVVD